MWRQGRDWSNVSTGPEMAKMGHNHQILERGKKEFSPRAFRESANSLVMFQNRWASELWENKFLLF